MAESYVPKTWVDGTTGGTPINAAGLNRVEQAIADLYAQLAALKNTPATRAINYTAVADRAIKAVKEPADWAATNNVKLLVGEFGWPATNDSGYDSRYDNEGDAFLTYCDSRNLPVTQWSSSEWGLDLKAYRNADNGSSALTTVTNVGVVKARHGVKSGNMGVNLAGAEFGVSPSAPLSPARGGTGFRWSTQATWQFLAAQGQRVIRLPFSWERIQPTPMAALDSTYLAALQQQLTYATGAGLKVIIDCHNYARYTFTDGHLARIGETYNGVDMQGAFVDLWTRLATALKNHTALAASATTPAGYGLMNEPHDLPIGSNTFEAQTWQKASVAAHYAIRNVGDTTSGVFSSGYFYASAAGWVSLNGNTPWHYKYGPNGTPYANVALNADPFLFFETHLYLDTPDGGIYNRSFDIHLSEDQAAGYTAGTITA